MAIGIEKNYAIELRMIRVHFLSYNNPTPSDFSGKTLFLLASYEAGEFDQQKIGPFI